MREITYTTPNGSSNVVVTANRSRIDFDWVEEGGCIDCEVDVDATRSSGFNRLVWICSECGGGSAPLAISQDINPN